MSKYDRLKKQSDAAFAATEKPVGNRGGIADELHRVSQIAYHAGDIISDLDKRFSEATKLNGVDISFLFLATALQCARQYLLTPFKERLDDKTAAKNTPGHTEESTSRVHKWYHPSVEEIWTNPVPYDAIFGSKEFNLNIGGGFEHRAKTLGHDPILGWIFGTANILTSTVTLFNFESYHVQTGTIATGAWRDKISNHADTFKIFEYTGNRLLHEGDDGKEAFGYALTKQAIHLRSDIYTTVSLPLPIISTASPAFSKQIASYGFDSANILAVGKQAGYSILINSIIAMIHRLFFNEATDGDLSLYKVRTRKILSYSNVLAAGSNILAVALMEATAAATGNKELAKKGMRYIDIGGYLVALHRIVSDYRFIQNIKVEFMREKWYDLVMGDEFNF